MKGNRTHATYPLLPKPPGVLHSSDIITTTAEDRQIGPINWIVTKVYPLTRAITYLTGLTMQRWITSKSLSPLRQNKRKRINSQVQEIGFSYMEKKLVLVMEC